MKLPIDYVNIPITFKADGMLQIKLNYNNVDYDIVSNERVTAGQSKTYRIDKEAFDFTDKKIDDIRIIVNVQ